MKKNFVLILNCDYENKYMRQMVFKAYRATGLIFSLDIERSSRESGSERTVDNFKASH